VLGHGTTSDLDGDGEQQGDQCETDEAAREVARDRGDHEHGDDDQQPDALEDEESVPRG